MPPSSLPTLAPKKPGGRQPADERPVCKEHTEAEWLAKKDIIRHLYMEDNRKLTDIMAIMEALSRKGERADAGFSGQMYKKRFRKWNIRKRNYRKTPTASPASTPASGGEDSLAPAEDDVEVEEVPRLGDDAETFQQALLCQPSKSGPYAGLELVLDSVCSWGRGKLDGHRVSSDPMSRYLAHPNRPPIQDSRTMYRTFELVFDLWNRGRGDLAGMAARKGFYILEFVLTDDHPDLVWHVLDTIYDMVDRGHLQLLGLFLQHASVLASRQLPANHPLLRIIKELKKCKLKTEEERQYVCHMLRMAWLHNVDLLGAQVGSLKPQELWLYEQLIWDARTRLRKNSGLARQRDTMLAALRQLSANHSFDCEDKTGSDRLRIEALMLEFTQMDIGDRQQAEKLAVEMLRHTDETDDGTRSNARFQAYARKMLGRLYEEKQDWEGAEQNMRCAVAKREAAHGTTTDLRVIRDMWVLSAHLQRAGRDEDARQIAADAVSRAQRYLEDVAG